MKSPLPVFLLATALFCAGSLALRAAPVAVGGLYENEGTAVQTETGYTGPVALRALLAADFDFARGLTVNPDVQAIEVIQKERLFEIRALKEKGAVEWSAEWQRNGGFEATDTGLKFLLRTKRKDDDFFMFTLSPLNDGAILQVQIDLIHATTFGPQRKDQGTFIFLRKSAP